MAELKFITPDWPAPINVKAFCSTRGGGFSCRPYDSLNVGEHVGDDLNLVYANRDLLPQTQDIVWLNQNHSTTSVELTRSSKQKIAADASYTTKVGIVCAVMSADCLPILLCNKSGSLVAAIHAGWKGLAAGIIENTVQNFVSDKNEILAWLGPAISQAHFEVGDNVYAALGDYPGAFIPNKQPDKYRANLYQIAREKLAAAGVYDIYGGNHCTYGESKLFFSHRRSTHEGLHHTGRMVSAIYLDS
ncbi:MAG: YfiH family protein [Paraglaciecola sp.]|jgi:YfiH family protein